MSSKQERDGTSAEIFMQKPRIFEVFGAKTHVNRDRT